MPTVFPSLIAEKAKENQGERVDICPKLDKCVPIDTKEIIAKAAGVSHGTLAKVEKLEKQAALALDDVIICAYLHKCQFQRAVGLSVA